MSFGAYEHTQNGYSCCLASTNIFSLIIRISAFIFKSSPYTYQLNKLVLVMHLATGLVIAALPVNAMWLD